MIRLEYIDKGNTFDFGNISEYYAKYRDVYPDEFFRQINSLRLCGEGKLVLDLGTGTGVLPRHLAKYGAKFVGADISERQIAQARALSNGLNIDYIVSPAEEVDFPDETFDTVLACMCFTYFDKAKLMPRLHRMLKNDGRFAIMSMVWLPKESYIAAKSEDLILKYNPDWNGVNYDRPTFDARGIPTTYKIGETSGFAVDTSFAFDVPVGFTRETWHGRMRATRGLASSVLSKEKLAAFDKEHKDFLDEQPESFEVLHSVTFCVLKKEN